ncbi:MAG: disulfide bond formation protein B [Hyphomonadaceae bacterium]|nr:disulfide bond formation protein B [Hyphomonadaceae bacterium]
MVLEDGRENDAARSRNIESHNRRTWWLLLAAWLIALSAALGALFIGEIMGQAPCLLCWYQRAFMFPLAVVLLVACISSDAQVWRYALPLAAIGWLVALYHTLLYAGVIPAPIQQCGVGPSCSSGDMSILGWVSIPLLSWIAFSAIVVLLSLVRRRPS